MKKRKFNSILLSGVLIIWIFVIKKAVLFLGTEPKENTIVFVAKPLAPMPKIRKDTFDFISLKRDPFLEHQLINRPLDKKKQVSGEDRVSPNHSQKMSQLHWPKLQYYGYIKGDLQSKKLVLLKIDNKLYKVRETQMTEGIRMLKAYEDSLLVKKDGKLKMIFK